MFKKHLTTDKKQFREKKLTKWSLLCWGIIAIVFLFSSQIIKYELLNSSQFINEKNNFINIQAEENSTYFFGLIQNTNSTITLLIIATQIFFTFTISVIVLFWKQNFIQFCIGLILLGSWGNLINRLWNNGKIIDYIKIGQANNYINFNLEDLLIITGMLLLIMSFIQHLVWQIRQRK